MNDVALLVVDMQNDVLNRMVEQGRDIVPAVRKALDYFRIKELPVVHVVRVHRPDGADVELFRKRLFEDRPFLVRGTEGAQVVEELAPAEGEYVVEKQRFSAFFQTNLDMLLRRLGVRTVVIAGVQTPNCVRATAVDAVCLDYGAVVLSDATVAKTPEVHEANLLDLGNMGVKVMTTLELMRSLR